MFVKLFRPALIVGSLPVTLTNGTVADATQVMSDLNWIANQVNANAAPLANTALLNANNNFTTVQSGVNATSAANFPLAGQVQNQAFNTLTSTLGTNAIIARISGLPLSGYVSGQVFTFVPSQTNTGPANITIDLIGSGIIFSNGTTLIGGELIAGVTATIVRNSPRFDLVSVKAVTPTPSIGDSSNNYANTAFVAAAVPFANWTPFNAEDRVWGAGIATVKTSWTAYGAGATYAKNTTAAQFRGGVAGSSITRAGTDCGQSATLSSYPGWPAINYWQGKTCTYGRWVYATAASRARVQLADSTGSTFSSYHPGDSTLRFLTVTRTIDPAATSISVADQVDTGNTTAVFSGGGFVTGSYLTDAMPPAWVGRKAITNYGFNAAGLLTAGSTAFFQAGQVSATEATVVNTVAFGKAVFRNLVAYSNTSPGGGQTYTVTFRSNADTALTCTVGVSQVGSDLTHEVALAQSAAYAVKCVASAGAATTTGLTFSTEVEEVPL